uniref:Uncharacterized protein n=1 Tax=Romanomermis culicivorax TaxID=13658 RepID=A0A915K9Q5_ROMCU
MAPELSALQALLGDKPSKLESKLSNRSRISSSLVLSLTSRLFVQEMTLSRKRFNFVNFLANSSLNFSFSCLVGASLAPLKIMSKSSTFSRISLKTRSISCDIRRRSTIFDIFILMSTTKATVQICAKKRKKERDSKNNSTLTPRDWNLVSVLT